MALTSIVANFFAQLQVDRVTCVIVVAQWLSITRALGVRTRGLRFDRFPGRAAIPWLAEFGKLFTHIASAVSQPQETGVEKGSFGA